MYLNLDITGEYFVNHKYFNIVENHMESLTTNWYESQHKANKGSDAHEII